MHVSGFYGIARSATTWLFKASAETTLEIAATSRHLGARIGFMSVLRADHDTCCR